MDTALAFANRRLVVVLSLTELSYLQSLAAAAGVDLLAFVRDRLGLRRRIMGRKTQAEALEVLADAISKCEQVGLDPDIWAGKMKTVEATPVTPSGDAPRRRPGRPPGPPKPPKPMGRRPGRPPGPPKPPRPMTESEEASLHFNRVWNDGQRNIARAEGREFDESILLPETLEALREHKAAQRKKAVI